jgi:predicted RNase H-like nuclease (RuvC/YqgF family)
VLGAAERHERDALAGVVAHRRLRPLLAELTPEHFHDPVHRTLRSHLVDGSPLDSASVALLAELDARAEREGIDESTGKELLLRLRERQLRSELHHAGLERTRELQDALTRLRAAYD